jgi:hypothetical protein
MKIIKCHQCRHVWVYTGGAESRCICSRCRTTVAFHREVPVVDQTPATIASFTPADLGNVAYPVVDVYDRGISLVFVVYAEDGGNTRTLPVSADLLDALGIRHQDLIDAVIADGGNTVRSGRHPVTPVIRDAIRAAFPA